MFIHMNTHLFTDIKNLKQQKQRKFIYENIKSFVVSASPNPPRLTG